MRVYYKRGDKLFCWDNPGWIQRLFGAKERTIAYHKCKWRGANGVAEVWWEGKWIWEHRDDIVKGRFIRKRLVGDDKILDKMSKI